MSTSTCGSTQTSQQSQSSPTSSAPPTLRVARRAHRRGEERGSFLSDDDWRRPGNTGHNTVSVSSCTNSRCSDNRRAVKPSLHIPSGDTNSGGDACCVASMGRPRNARRRMNEKAVARKLETLPTSPSCLSELLQQDIQRHGGRQGHHLPQGVSSAASPASGTSSSNCDGLSVQQSVFRSLPCVALPLWAPSFLWDAKATVDARARYPPTEMGLNVELFDFFKHVQLTDSERAERASLQKIVEEATCRVWPGQGESNDDTCAVATKSLLVPDLVLYGSYALGLSLPSSDIDFALVFPNEWSAEEAAASSGRPNMELPCPTTALHSLAAQLRCTSLSSHEFSVEVFDQCRIPRMRILHHHPRLDIDTSCDVNASLNKQGVQRVLQRQQRWLAHDPAAVFLVLLTKAALKQWGFNELYTGGIPSTAVYALVLRYLAQVEKHFLVSQKSRATTKATAASPSTPPPSYSAVHLEGGSGCEGEGKVAVAEVPQSSRAVSPLPPKGTESEGEEGESESWSQEGLTYCSESTMATPTTSSASSTPVSFPSTFCVTRRTSTVAPSPGSLSDSLSACGVEEFGSPTSHVCNVAPKLELATAEQLFLYTKRRYGVSPARLLLNLWSFLSADAFLTGYQVVDVFGDDALWSGVSRESSPSMLLPSLEEEAARPWPNLAALEAGTYASSPSSDITAASYRVPELLALFRCTSNNLENAIRSNRFGCSMSGYMTVLSTVFTDPRSFF